MIGSLLELYKYCSKWNIQETKSLIGPNNNEIVIIFLQINIDTATGLKKPPFISSDWSDQIFHTSIIETK